jgi:molybdenum cofactor cytidylyltransferase
LQPRRAALILGELPGMKENVFRGTVTATRNRLEGLGSRLALVLRCRHEKGEYAAKLREARAAGCDLLLIAGATVTKDRLDTVPAAVVAVGGAIDHFGMPVEPGNMLLLAHPTGLGRPYRCWCCPAAPARAARTASTGCCSACLPDCRSAAPRSCAWASAASSAARSNPRTRRRAKPRACPPCRRHAQRRRAGARRRAVGAHGRNANKLLAEVDGVPMLARAANAALASLAASVTVVLGHEAEQGEALLAGRPLNVVRNPDYAQGMSTSLAAGLAALPAEAEAVVVLLADMPRVNASHIDRLIDAFDPKRPAIVVPMHDGRRGNPVLWPRERFREMQAVTRRPGCARLLERHAARIATVEMDAAIHADVDTPDDLRKNPP